MQAIRRRRVWLANVSVATKARKAEHVWSIWEQVYDDGKSGGD
jgi:hypothetical protein